MNFQYLNKVIRVAFYLENKDIADVDLSQPELGNPGCGGTEYLFAATPYYINKYFGESYSLIILANEICSLPKQIESHQVDDVYSAARKAKEIEAEIFIYRPRRNEEDNFLELIETLKLPTIGWAHITPKSNYLRRMAQFSYFKALVCVEHEQYDQIQDSLLAVERKATYIVNGFDVEQFRLEDVPEKNEKLVVYLGALVPKKGFHMLAKVWPQVIKRVPEATLTVIGSGKLYDHAAELGPWGIAESNYEERYIIPYLSGDDGGVHNSVKFVGRMGLEKKDILSRALIGVPNPTGTTENCPGSALEFQACGTAVVSGGYWGMLDTIDHGVTGLLGKTELDLENHIVEFLLSPEKAKNYGKNGISFVKNKYDWRLVVENWIALFETINQSEKLNSTSFKSNYSDHYKWLIFINRRIQMLVGRYLFWPSVAEVRTLIYPKISCIKSKILRLS